ncbi:UvrD-helicase domain-containing protein [Halobacteriovorax sp. DA5]|uniref:UvrD-helicase domain-containing protein n=1 Tax=Halobacteriovorax sp. DA5 TaxID=2067553 RepID=UPI000CD26E41|nr:UvrD-helicase domain-containing protein [Halobacteriovorax sp. DA5]POB15136.1 hypothetical protein C0Z22_01780 [Halobacteriovorax sp. DA5]
MLSEISVENKNEEYEIQNQINSCLRKTKSFVFNAGAGAGKTFALISAIKYLINSKHDFLNYHSRKVMCITYTNIAVKEILERLGSTEIVKVSTIHESMWRIIKDYQEELLIVHTKKIENELESLKYTLDIDNDEGNSRVFSKYRKLDNLNKEEFNEIIKQKKEIFYNNYRKDSATFRASFDDSLREFRDLLSNVSDFKKIVKIIYKIDQYNNALECIRNKEDGYKYVRYESKYNSDILHRMIFSHDTLLEYAYEVISSNDFIKQVVVDSYPYFLVDEYQDTDPCVVKIISCLNDFSNENNRDFVAGYFGDNAQNIYDSGVGDDLQSLHKDLLKIDKGFNRRSCREVVNLVSNIRNDDLKQRSIYSDSEGGSIEFYYSKCINKKEVTFNFIRKVQEELYGTLNTRINCLVLTNKLISELSGFDRLYAMFSNTDFYRNVRFDSLNTELMSRDYDKLGNVVKIIYNLVNVNLYFRSAKISVSKIFPKDVIEKASYKEILDMVSEISSVSGETLYEYLGDLFNVFNMNSNSTHYSCFKKYIFNSDISSVEDLLSYFLDELYPSSTENDVEDKMSRIIELLNIDLKEYCNWFDFITENSNDNILFHTYHGTKGREFDNVILVMQNDFGVRQRNVFSNYFHSVINEKHLVDENDLKRNNSIKNLFYVACSRSILNLRVLYLDDIEPFREGIESLFSTISYFDVE